MHTNILNLDEDDKRQKSCGLIKDRHALHETAAKVAREDKHL